MLRTSDAGRAAAELSWQLADLADREEYLRAAGVVLLDLLGGDLVGWNALDARTGRAEARMFPEPHHHSRLDEVLADVADDHPLIVSYLAEPPDGIQRPRRLSDVTDREALRRTKAYEQILEPIQADHQLSLLTARLSATSFHAWGVTRSGGHDFDDRAVDLASRLQPLLALLDRLCTTTPPPGENVEEAIARVGLTARETEVLRLLGRGLTAAAIARVLADQRAHGAQAPRARLRQDRLPRPGPRHPMGEGCRPDPVTRATQAQTSITNVSTAAVPRKAVRSVTTVCLPTSRASSCLSPP